MTLVCCCALLRKDHPDTCCWTPLQPPKLQLAAQIWLASCSGLRHAAALTLQGVCACHSAASTRLGSFEVITGTDCHHRHRLKPVQQQQQPCKVFVPVTPLQHPQGWDPLKSSQAPTGKPVQQQQRQQQQQQQQQQRQQQRQQQQRQQQQQQQQWQQQQQQASIGGVAPNQGTLGRNFPAKQAVWHGASTGRTPEQTGQLGMAEVEAAMQGTHLDAGTRLTALPPDCWAHIFQFCQGPETKRSFFSTCKALRCDAVAAQIEVLTVSCLPKDTLISIAAMERFASWCPNLSTLCLKACGGTEADSDDDLLYSSEGEDYSEDEYGWGGTEWATTGDLLQLLNTAKKSPPAAALLSRITRLHLVDFEDFKAHHAKPLVAVLKAACPQLSSLSLEDVDMDTSGLSALKPLQLKELAIECFEDEEDEPLLKLGPLVQMPSLQAIKLDCDALMGRLGVLGRMHQLKKLDIQSIASGMGDTEEFDDALQGLRNLEVLQLDTLPEDTFTPPPSLKSLVIGYLDMSSLIGLADLQEHKIPCIKILSITFDNGLWPTHCNENDKYCMECARTVAAMPEIDWHECRELRFDFASVRLFRPRGAGSRCAPELPSSIDDGVLVDLMGQPGTTFWALDSVLTVLALFAGSGLARSVRSLVFREADVSIKSMHELISIFQRVSSLTYRRCVMSRGSLVEAVRRWPYLDSVDVSGLCVLDVEMGDSVNSSPTTAVVAGMAEKAKQADFSSDGAVAGATPPRPLSIILRRTWGKAEVSYERSLGEKKIAEVVAAWKRLSATCGQGSLVHVEVVDGLRKRPALLMPGAAENWDHIWGCGMGNDLMEVESEISERDY
ncbi:hypothetical protein DUNSADRAFT_6545 [Dunaliella salina]|uniref:Uncharacterized protein n=1 Tax=Dunaliella salina TaxID=3046 RepID=A0ABQ7GN39_DUNSA|nr:hypothetical protein DUNSADRAFT_6545 [Dunaliella salina]|eukprot:KAF5836024.1 hypothetical protein DUNSADRAFT_6545 [Dunaliella salina]